MGGGGGGYPADALMTIETNPEVLAICYAQGWCAHDKYMTYSEAAAVTDISTKFDKNKNITHFEELEYFGVTSFASTAFRGCTNLESVVLGANVTSLGDYMFNSSGLKRLIINSTDITNWGTSNTFRSCPVEYIYSKSVTTTPLSSTLNMQSLTTLVLDTTVRTAGGFRCPLLTNVTIKEGVTIFSNYGFRGCSSLVSITLPSTTATLDGQMFYDCLSLQRVTILAETPPACSTSTGTFGNVTNVTIYVPSGSVEVYKAASGWSRYASWIQAIPST